MWCIRRRERSLVIEVFKIEESGYGDILSREFVDWRNKANKEKQPDVDVAGTRLLGELNEGSL